MAQAMIRPLREPIGRFYLFLLLPLNWWRGKKCPAWAGVFCERTVGHVGKHQSFGGTRW